MDNLVDFFNKVNKKVLAVVAAIVLVVIIVVSIFINGLQQKKDNNIVDNNSNSNSSSSSTTTNTNSTTPSVTPSVVQPPKTTDNKDASNAAINYIKILNERDYNMGYPGFNLSSLNGLVDGPIKQKVDSINQNVNSHSGNYDNDWNNINSNRLVEKVVVDKTTIYDHSDQGYYNVVVQWHLDINSNLGHIVGTPTGNTIIVKQDGNGKYICYDDAAQQTP